MNWQNWTGLALIMFFIALIIPGESGKGWARIIAISLWMIASVLLLWR